jgi:hypothetical protein
MSSQAIADAEIKSLLILLLLKSGTRAEEIRTAMRMATASTLAQAEERTEERPTVAKSGDRPLDRSLAIDKMRPLTPKQIVRNDYLAPIKGYAA